MFTVYVLQSESTGRFYIGQTKDLEHRLRRHLAGRTRSARNRGPWHLVYSEEYVTRAEAVRRERQMKNWKSRKYLEKLLRESDG